MNNVAFIKDRLRNQAKKSALHKQWNHLTKKWEDK